VVKDAMGNVRSEVESYYDVRAETYDEWLGNLYFRIYDAITWKYVEPYVPTSPNALVLDAAGGTGRWAIRLAKKGCKVVLMDISEGMLKIAAKRAREEGVQDKIVIRKGNISKMGCGDGTFDMVLCEHALFTLNEPDSVVSEFKRVLRKKTRLVITAQNRYVQSLSSIPRKPSPSDVEHAFKLFTRERYDYISKESSVRVYSWTPNEFRALLERNGFRVEKIIGKGVTMPLRVSSELYMQKNYPEDLYDSLLRFELLLCEDPDALTLAGHLQAVAYKR
jgi:ubiquinone/menaquinone biosynthesis C-methylase UbiE